jgi:hypothetical protein
MAAAPTARDWSDTPDRAVAVDDEGAAEFYPWQKHRVRRIGPGIGEVLNIRGSDRALEGMRLEKSLAESPSSNTVCKCLELPRISERGWKNYGRQLRYWLDPDYRARIDLQTDLGKLVRADRSGEARANCFPRFWSSLSAVDLCLR